MNKTKVTNFYNESAQDYNTVFYNTKKSYSPLKERQKLMLDLLDKEVFAANPKILDIGCGPGELVFESAKRGFETWGIDISHEMIKLAQQKIGTELSSIHLDVGDIEHLSFSDNFFDVVIGAGIIEYLDSDDIWIKEISRVLKPNGILILNITNRYAIRRLTLPLFEKLKQSSILLSSMNFIKNTLLHKGKINYLPFKHRVHSPNKFDSFLQQNGFTKISHQYFDLCLFPYPFDTVFSFILNIARKYFSKYSSKNMVIFGCGYIVKARIIKPQDSSSDIDVS